MLDPKDLFVYVVGIDFYAGGEDWDLRGCVSDALEFAEWLIQRGVPVGNIQAFLAPHPLEDPLVSKPKLAGKLKVRAATASEIYGALARELSAAKPRHFCLFWSGHGCITKKDERYLFGSESTDEHIDCIDVTDFVRYLGTDALGPPSDPGSRQFITIVDACATFADVRGMDQSDDLITAHPFPRRSRVDRSQCAIFATNPGESALELPRRGLFSYELQKQLERPARARLDLLQQLEGAAWRLEKQFRHTTQRPYFYNFQPFNNGPRTVGAPRLETIDQPFAKLSVSIAEMRDLMRHMEAIHSHVSPEAVRQMFDQALGIPTSGSKSAKNLMDLSECVELLCRGIAGPIFTFLALCRSRCAKKHPDIAAALDTWQKRVARRIGADLKFWHDKGRMAAPEATPSVRRPKVIQLIVDPVFGYAYGNEHYQMRAALCDAEATDPAEIVIVATSDTVPARQLPEVLRGVFREALLKAKTTHVRIEAVLPAELLPAGAQDWFTRFGAEDVHVSTKYPFGLRSHERGYDGDYLEPRLLQQDKWRSLTEGLTRSNVAWAENLAGLADTELQCWHDSNTLALFALQFCSTDPKQQARAVEQLLTSGIPLGVWFHDPKPPVNGWRACLEQHFMDHPCENWPPRAKAFHTSAHGERPPTCTGLALLWDNPEQPLPEPPGSEQTPLQAPSLGITS